MEIKFDEEPEVVKMVKVQTKLDRKRNQRRAKSLDKSMVLSRAPSITATPVETLEETVNGKWCKAPNCTHPDPLGTRNRTGYCLVHKHLADDEIVRSAAGAQ